MNDELQRQLALFIESSKEVAINGVSFLSGEVPEVIRQLLMWKAVQSGLMFVVGVLFVFFCILYQKVGENHATRRNKKRIGWYVCF